MDIIIKRMETDEEIKGKAFVHWKAWHEAYPDLVSQEYLDNLTYEKCESMAFSWRDNLIVAIDGNKVIGFVGYGNCGEESPNAGEIFALYILSEWRRKGKLKNQCSRNQNEINSIIPVCLFFSVDIRVCLA